MSPALFDLTSLQREANARFVFSAKTTLALAQTLYERHKALTYPRTDSRYLTEDYISTVQQTMEALAEGGSSAGANTRPFAETLCKQKWVRPNRRLLYEKKESAKFAIHNTLQGHSEIN